MSNVDLIVLFSQLKVLHISLSNVLTPTFEILVFIKATYCYSNVLTAYRIHLNVSDLH